MIHRSNTNREQRPDWSFKEENKPAYIPIKKKNVKQKKNKKKKNPAWLNVRSKITDFYKSEEWRSLRYRVLKKYGACCMACGRSKKDHNVVIHVDHIKPRSTHPNLQLNFDNLQVLCEDCNIGKGNKDCIDYRPDDHSDEIAIVMSAMVRL